MKYINKIKTIVFLILISSKGFSQISTTPVEITLPAPSVSNLMNMVDIPINTHTGVPNIDIPLINIPTTSKNVNVNISLSYHPAGIAFTSRASDVGTGWNLIAGGAISRTVVGLPDEYLKAHYQVSGGDINQIVFDDIYSYNFMGYSGKFKIVYKQSDNTHIIHKLEVNNLDITCVMTTQQTVESFTIYDDKGSKYVFSVKDRNKSFYLNRSWLNIHEVGITEPYQPIPDPYYHYSAYHLSGVHDNNNVKLIDVSYISHVKSGGIPSLDEVTNKVSIIESINFGTISFDYDYYEPPVLENKFNDPFMLNNITLMNIKDEIINKFNLNYYELNIHKVRRHLYKIKKKDVLNQKTEDHEFEYQTEIINTSPFYCNEDFYYGTDKFGYLNLTGNPFFEAEYEEYVTDGMFYEDFEQRTSKEACLYGVLKKIKFPTGGITEFKFEANSFRYSSNPSNPTLDFSRQYDIENTDNHIYTQILNTHYTTKNGTKQIPLLITGTEPVKLFIKVYPQAYYSQLNDPVDEPLYASFRLLGNRVDKILERTTPNCLGSFIQLNPGNYIIKVNSLETSSGDVVITKKEPTTQPLKQWVYGGGLRIKKISYFNSYFDTTPQREVNYDYNMFNDANLTSGELYDGFFRSFATKRATSAQIGYKNVKIFDTQNNGYSKHTYEGYTDSQYYANSASLNYFQNYFGYKNGILKKVEVFNSNNDILKKTENQYEFTEYGYSMYINSMLDFNYGWFHAKPCWAKLTNKTTKSYFYPNGSSTPNITQTDETYAYNSVNKQISERTVTNSNTETLKTKYFYHTGNSIYSQNRIAEIESIETYRGAELLSKSKVNYGNVWQNNVSLLPQTIATAKGTNAFENRVEYKQYDEFSNPLEVQQTSGIPITYIWGYNKTLPIAKIENATYAQVQSYVANLQTLSNGTNEGNLITALDALRVALPNAMVTTYTHKPLIGLSTVTDPKGDKITYHYDNFNRLQFVKDKNENILSENEYHYKN